MATRPNSNKQGLERIRDPLFNKGSAFTGEERRRHKLRGLLPHAVETEEQQLARELANLQRKGRGLEDRREQNLEKYIYLMELLNRNEALFYKMIVQNIRLCMPLVYTPTVGDACLQFSHIFSQPHGIYITIEDRGHIEQILRNWHTKDVKAIVFTDGERILGLGDLGINGMGIPIGKLQLYSACARVPPWQCLPVCIDVGTETERYLNDPMYMGLKQRRTRGQPFVDLIEEFMKSCQKVFGKTVLLQFEDFGNETAFHLLETFRNRFTTFNDDIQGTACVAAAGVMASLRMEGAPQSLRDHKILFFGAGEAGTGIGSLVAYSIAKEDGIPIEEARKNIWFVDSRGLITSARGIENLPHHKQPWAHDGSNLQGDITTLLGAVRALKPTTLIGVSAQPNTFTEEVIRLMAENNERPIIFALSNPTSKCECTASDAYTWSEGRCVFASGSPFEPVELNGRRFEPGQGNNAYIFPGLALGVIAAQASVIPEDLFYATARCLAELVTQQDLDRGSLYPPLEQIQQVSVDIACRVAEDCFNLGIATVRRPRNIRELVESKQFTV